MSVEEVISDCESTHRTGDSRELQLVAKRKTAVARSLLFGAPATCLLLWVALYNGYPTVYPDTASYIFTGAFFRALPPFRSPGYSIFIEFTSLGASAWFTIVAQAILVVSVLYETCKYLIGGESAFRDKAMLAIVCVLALLTSLPWEASLLMPDVFAGMVFLSSFLLAFNARLGLTERIGLAAVLAISVSAHISLLPIAAVFVAALAIPRIAGYQMHGAPSAKSMFLWLLVPLVVAALWTATLNRKMGLGFKVSPSGNEFFLGRLFGDGLAADFLRENCPKKSFVACGYLNNLPKTPEQFLFWSPLLHDMNSHGDEVSEVVRGTLATYPLRFVRSSIEQTLRQLVSLRTGDEVRDLALHAPNSNAAVIQRVFPRDFHAFSNSRLIGGHLVPLTNAVARIDTAMFWLCVVGCVVLARKQRMGRLNRFFYSAIVFLFINAAICATLAGVYDRYQARVAWIVPLCLTSYVCCLIKERLPHPPSSHGHEVGIV